MPVGGPVGDPAWLLGSAPSPEAWGESVSTPPAVERNTTFERKIISTGSVEHIRVYISICMDHTHTLNTLRWGRRDIKAASDDGRCILGVRSYVISYSPLKEEETN